MSDRKKTKEFYRKLFGCGPSKPAAITLNLGGTESDKLYCVCRSADCSGFMICCDNCEEWYHGSCIQVTEAEAKYIERYYCGNCRKKNRSLQTVFCMLPKHHMRSAFQPSRRASTNSMEPPKRVRTKKHQLKHCQREHPCTADSMPAVPAIAPAPKPAAVVAAVGVVPAVAAAAVTISTTKPIVPAMQSYACGNCSGCRKPACGKCVSCCNCELRVCLMQQQFKSQVTIPTTNANSSETFKKPAATTTQKTTMPSTAATKTTTPPIPEDTHSQLICKRSNDKDSTKSSSRRYSVDGHYYSASKRQCYGPGCCKTARPESKYCSDECGFRLGIRRLFSVLPQRLQEWNLTKCHADTQNRQALREINNKKETLRQTVLLLDKQQQELEELIEMGKHNTLDLSMHNGTTMDDEQYVACVTCGHATTARTIIKHMEKCFNRTESKANFGSLFKAHHSFQTVVCDFYNIVSKTYCKRLRVICPEHRRDPKYSDNALCGCPLLKNVFTFSGKFCCTPKNNCMQHYAWEKIRRASIDLERLRALQKLEELNEEERKLRRCMSLRGGLMSLLLHSTTDHESKNNFF